MPKLYLHEIVGSITKKRLQWEQRSPIFNSIRFFRTSAGNAPNITFERQKLRCQVKPKKSKINKVELSITGIALDYIEVRSIYIIKASAKFFLGGGFELKRFFTVVLSNNVF